MIFFSLKSYKNLCLFGFYNDETEEKTFFEISEYYNDLKPLLVFLKNNQKEFLVGYNMENFNNYMLNFILTNFNSLLEEKGVMVAFQLNSISLSIINGVADINLKYSNYFKFIDLMKYVGNSNDRISMNDLKYLFEIEDANDFPETENGFIDKINKNDVFDCIRNNLKTLKIIYDINLKKIMFRFALGKEVGLNLLNKYDESIGNNYLLGKYMQKYKVPKNSFLQLKQQEKKELLDLNSFLQKEFIYKNKSINDFYELIKNNISHEVEIPNLFNIEEQKFFLNNKQIRLEIKETLIKEDLINIDFKYIYIEYLIRNKIYPNFLDEDFYLMIEEVYVNLLIAIRNNNIQEIEKCDLILNKIIENMSVPSSFTESKYTQYKIYINVLFIILELIDDLISLKAKIILCDKNYITIQADSNREEIIKCINSWHNKYYSNKSISIYDKLVFSDYNNYLIFKSKKYGSDYLITKGFFQEKRNLNSRYPLIIIKAFRLHIENKIDIKDYINKQNDINDFIVYYKTNRTFDLIYNKSPIQRNLRFVYSPKGYDLYRINKEKNKEELVAKKIQLLIKKEDAEIDKSIYLSNAISFKNQFIKTIQKSIW